MKLPYKHQNSNEVIHTGNWYTDSPTYEEGARTKSTLFSPQETPYNFILPEHRYLSKKSSERGPVQFWMEIIAYRLGCLWGISVPPCFVSIANDGSCRSLCEWFFVEGDENYLPAYGLLKAIDKSLDKEKGKRHTYNLVMQGLLAAHKIESGLRNAIKHDHPDINLDDYCIRSDFKNEFIKIMVFDALIGNTDRHHENWGLHFQKQLGMLLEFGGEKISFPEPLLSLAPAFDNGTSLGYNIPADKVKNYIKDKNWFKSFVRKGTHHIRPEIDEKNFSHVDLIVKFLSDHPAYVDEVQKVISFDLKDVKAILSELTAFQIPVPFTQERSEFTLKIIEAKQSALLEALEDA